MWDRHPGAVVDHLWKNAKMGLGLSVLDNLLLNNSLPITHRHFQYFTFPGEIISKYDPLEQFDPPWNESLIFTLGCPRCVHAVFPVCPMCPCSQSVRRARDVPRMTGVHGSIEQLSFHLSSHVD